MKIVTKKKRTVSRTSLNSISLAEKTQLIFADTKFAAVRNFEMHYTYSTATISYKLVLYNEKEMLFKSSCSSKKMQLVGYVRKGIAHGKKLQHIIVVYASFTSQANSLIN